MHWHKLSVWGQICYSQFLNMNEEFCGFITSLKTTIQCTWKIETIGQIILNIM